MKRFFLSGVLLALAGVSLAQGTFTIRRPADGSTVRETVNIRLPKKSIPDGGYIGVYVNGKFLEATMPDVDADGEYVYKLDTKARKLPDGEHTIEVVLFVDYQDKPRAVNRSSVKVTIDNQTSIKIKPAGELLRYKFPTGKEWIYSAKIKSKVSVVSQALAQVGGRAAERDLSEQSTRIMYAVDNNYGAEGLVRIQGLPDRGRDYTVVTVGAGTEPAPRFSFEMHPIYMRISNTGREVFSSAPPYFPLEGTGGDSFRTDLYYNLPLPILPSRAVKPGDVWNAPFLVGALNLDEKDEKETFTTGIDSRGSFEGVEWYRGRRAAKIRSTVAAGPTDLANVQNLNNVEGTAAKIEIEQVVWFDLDRGMVIRVDRTSTQESLIEVAAAGGSSSGAAGGAPSGPAGFSGAGGGGARRGALGNNMNRPNFLDGFQFRYNPQIDANGVLSLFQVGTGEDEDPDRRGRGGRGGFGSGQGNPGPGGFGRPGPGGPGGPGGFPGFQQPGQGGSQTSKQVLRFSSTITIELE